MPDVNLTDNEVNYLSKLLKETAEAKKRRAREVHPNDRADVEASAMRDYELRKKLVGAKAKTP
jgi:hypothetical protein